MGIIFLVNSETPLKPHFTPPPEFGGSNPSAIDSESIQPLSVLHSG